jgi:hypothetical protein
MLVGLAVGGYGYLLFRKNAEKDVPTRVVEQLEAKQQLAAAIAEADRLDPGWRLEELEDKRAAIPEEENSATIIMAVGPKIPNNWPSFETARLFRRLPYPPAPLGDQQASALHSELSDIQDSIIEARKIVDYPRGRFPIVLEPKFTNPHWEYVRKLSRVLHYDTLERVNAGDLSGALNSCRGAFNVARSLGDEPSFISFLTRLESRDRALNNLERILAQGQVPSRELEAFQQILEEEETLPLLLIAARGERSGCLDIELHEVDYEIVDELQKKLLEAGGVDPSSYTPPPRKRLADTPELASALMLRYWNQFIEAAKLRVHQQVAIDQLKSPSLGDENDRFDPLRLGAEGAKRFARKFRYCQALLRCAIAMLAMDRFRLETGKWPASLDELCPKFLKLVPLDPYDGAPLRYRKVDEGVVVYSIGPSGKDHLGQLFTPGYGMKVEDCDLGFQLWDPDKRRQPAKEN